MYLQHVLFSMLYVTQFPITLANTSPSRSDPSIGVGLHAGIPLWLSESCLSTGLEAIFLNCMEACVAILNLHLNLCTVALEAHTGLRFDEGATSVL